jgi:hypothetical protein
MVVGVGFGIGFGGGVSVPSLWCREEGNLIKLDNFIFETKNDS